MSKFKINDCAIALKDISTYAKGAAILNGGFHYYGAYGQNDPVTGIIGEDELKSLKENENSVYHENP